ncbi:Acyl-coenzyme A thioesterase 8 [Aphelenchoides fujianensis]|nr:Acyl-coenzyme A thioesterase 8 [Aphelenchoides fujianensis]
MRNTPSVRAGGPPLSSIDIVKRRRRTCARVLFAVPDKRRLDAWLQEREAEHEADAARRWDFDFERLFAPKGRANATEKFVRKLMKLEIRRPNFYRSHHLISTPQQGVGALLFAQSLQSAQQTVERGIAVPHSMHTFFILNVDPGKHRRLPHPASYCTRSVQAEQNGKVVMSSQISFCAQEESSIEHQVAMPNVPDPESLVNTVDFCREHLEKQERGELEMSPLTSKVMANTLQGADDDLFLVRPCDPRKYYCLEESDVEPMCFWVKTKCALSDDREEHRFLVGYMTDFSLASVAVRPHCSRGYVPSMTLSLDHVVRFHDDNYRADEWLLYENWSPWAKYGRAFSEGRLWTRDGRLVLSSSQESVQRTRAEMSCL